VTLRLPEKRLGENYIYMCFTERMHGDRETIFHQQIEWYFTSSFQFSPRPANNESVENSAMTGLNRKPLREQLSPYFGTHCKYHTSKA
jgi:hypothetical protein